MMETLNIKNKTSFCIVLASLGYSPSPRQAEFTGLPRDSSWWLNWDENGKYYEAFISVCWGECLCSVKAGEERVVYTIPIPKLREWGLIVFKGGTTT